METDNMGTLSQRHYPFIETKTLQMLVVSAVSLAIQLIFFLLSEGKGCRTREGTGDFLYINPYKARTVL
jgi:hypothetical protein